MVNEGAATNAWILDALGVLVHAADNDILNGIVRQVLLDCVADLNLKFEEKPFRLTRLWRQKMLFDCLDHVGFPVIFIDGQKIGDGKPGAVAKQLSDAYDTVEKKLPKIENEQVSNASCVKVCRLMRRGEEDRVNKVTGRNLRRPQNKLGKPMSSRPTFGLHSSTMFVNKSWL